MSDRDTKNARKELMDVVRPENLMAAEISFRGKDIVLYPSYTDKELMDFLQALNYEYDSGYGTQYLDGVIWLKNGAWIVREEYDGSEWWAHRIRPTPPSR
jgi:hypothetical protein